MASIQKQFKISTPNFKNYEIISEEYNSAMDVANDCETRQITNHNFNDVRYSGDWGWNGCKNYDEAIDLLKNGYIDKVEKMQKEINKSVIGQSKRITFHNDIVGYAPIVPLAILGVPNSMINSKMKPIKAKVIEICYDVGCSACVNSDDIIRVGLAFLKIIANMEMQGYRIKLTAVQGYSTNSIVNLLRINLKSANQPLDLKRISFPTIHTGFFRVIGFDWFSKTPHGKYIGGGYGKPITATFSNKKDLREFVNQVFGKNTVYIAARWFVDVSDKNLENKIKNKIKEAIEDGCKINNS